jgi:hypothetical protein
MLHKYFHPDGTLCELKKQHNLEFYTWEYVMPTETTVRVSVVSISTVKVPTVRVTAASIHTVRIHSVRIPTYTYLL